MRKIRKESRRKYLR